SSRTARPATRSRRGRARWASSRATSSPSCPRPSSACRRRPVPRRRAGEATVRAREVTTHTPEETEALGEAFGRAARGGELIGLAAGDDEALLVTLRFTPGGGRAIRLEARGARHERLLE